VLLTVVALNLFCKSSAALDLSYYYKPPPTLKQTHCEISGKPLRTVVAIGSEYTNTPEACHVSLDGDVAFATAGVEICLRKFDEIIRRLQAEGYRCDVGASNPGPIGAPAVLYVQPLTHNRVQCRKPGTPTKELVVTIPQAPGATGCDVWVGLKQVLKTSGVLGECTTRLNAEIQQLQSEGYSCK
jgi:hypothetical protein